MRRRLIAQRKRDGKPPITDIHELESTLGTWRQCEQHSGSACHTCRMCTRSHGLLPSIASNASQPCADGRALPLHCPADKTQHENADGSAALAVPLDHTGPKGQPCGLAGQPVGKNTKCVCWVCACAAGLRSRLQRALAAGLHVSDAPAAEQGAAVLTRTVSPVGPSKRVPGKARWLTSHRRQCCCHSTRAGAL